MKKVLLIICFVAFNIAGHTQNSLIFNWRGYNGDLINRNDSVWAVVTTWRDGAIGAYSIVLDDFGVISFNKSVKPAWDLSKEAGFEKIKLSWGIVTKQMNDENWNNAVIMVSQGHEMVNHAMTHTDATLWNEKDLKYNINDANDLINKRVYEIIHSSGEYFAKGKRCEFFVYPYDSFNKSTHEYLNKSGFVGARGGERAIVMKANFPDPFRINFDAHYISNRDWTPDSKSKRWPNMHIGLNEAIDKIIEAKGYMIRELHSVPDIPDNAWFDEDNNYENWPINNANKGMGGTWGGLTKNQLRVHFEYLKKKIESKELAIYTLSEAVKYSFTVRAFENEAVLTASGQNWIIKLNKKPDVCVEDKYKEEISVIVDLGVAVEQLSVAYDRNHLNTNEDNSPRIKPRRMDDSGRIWSISINPFKSADHTALLIRDGKWFGQDIKINNL